MPSVPALVWQVAFTLAVVSFGAVGRAEAQPESADSALVARLCELDPGCCHFEESSSPGRLDRGRLDGRHEVLVLQCSRLTYNLPAAVFVREGRTIRPARVGSLPPAFRGMLLEEAERPHWRIGGYWDRETGSLHASNICRSLGDCGIDVRYRWSGGRFVPSRISLRDQELDGDAGTWPWPVVWPPSERCAFRWEIGTDGAPELVSLEGRRRRTSRGLVRERSCRVTGERHDLLECGDVAFDVVGGTSDDPPRRRGRRGEPTWDVWRVEDGSEPRRVVRVARGCAL